MQNTVVGDILIRMSSVGGNLVIRRRNSIRDRQKNPHDAGGMMRWLLTYADLITLLLAFFVVMYAISSADHKKFQALKSSLQVALKTGPASAGVIELSGNRIIEPPIALARSDKESVELRNMAHAIENATKNSQNKHLTFIFDERGLIIRFLEDILFDLGSADLRSDSKRLLDAVGTELLKSTYYIRVEGHADNLPIHTVKYPSNWELSAARSIAVTRYLIEQHGLDPQRLSSLGYGEYRPLFPNTSEQNRARNRRVDIVVLRSEHSGSEIDSRTK